jgi:ABC-type sugar transport system substrate-binding protein
MTSRQIRITVTRPRHLGLVGVACLSAALALNACSSSTNAGPGAISVAGTSSASGSSACMTKATDFLKSWNTLPESLPPQYTPLSKKPAAGGTVIKLVGPIPTDNTSFIAQQAAAAAIGWTAKKISYDGSVEDLNAKFEQAISEKPTVITLSGEPATIIERPLADAKAAGIVVSMDNIVNSPTANPGFAALTSGAPTTKLIGQLNAYMFMRDSGCKGSVAVFNLPFPILKVATDSFTQTVHANCPACQVSYNELAINEIGTPAGTSAIVSALQSSPSTKYVYTIISDVATGLPAALSQAGVTGIKVFGEVPDANAIESLRQGTSAWWIDQSAVLNGWTELDAALRALDSGKVIPDNGHYPLAILTPQNVGSSDIPTYPLDYQNEFKKLWLQG